MRTPLRLLALSLAIIAPACDDDSSTPLTAPDAGLDAAPLDGAPPDAGPDPDVEPGADTDPDPDTGPDPDAGPAGSTFTLLAGSSGTGFVDGAGPAARFNGVTCIALAGDTLYASDTFNAIVRAIDLDTGEVTTFAGRPHERATLDGPLGQARLEEPRGCAATADALIVADGPTIRRVELATDTLSTLAGAPGQRGNVDAIGAAARFGFLIHDIEPAPDGGLFLADRINDSLRHLDPSTGEVTTLVPNGLNGPGGLALDPRDGALYIADTFDGELSRWVDDGLGPVVGGLDTPQGVAIADGVAWLGGFDGLLHRVTLDTGEIEVALGVDGEAFARDGDAETARLGGTFASPVIDPARGRLYYVDLDTGAIRAVALDTLAVETLAGPVEPRGHRDGPGVEARFGSIFDVVHDGERWLVSDPDNDAIRAIGPDGATTTWLGVPGEADPVDGPRADARLDDPVGLAHDGARLYIADYANGSVRVVEGDTVTTLTDALEGPWGLGLGPDGLLHVTDLDAGAVYTLALDGTLTALAGPGSFTSPADVAVDPDGRVYVADDVTAAIYGVRPMGAPIVIAGAPDTTGVRDGPLTEALLAGPTGLTWAPDGALLVVDGPNHLIRRLDLDARRIDRLVGHPTRHGNLPPGATVPLADATLYRPQAVGVGGGQLAIPAEYGLVVVEPLP